MRSASTTVAERLSWSFTWARVKINFFSEEITFKPKHPAALRKWITGIIASEGCSLVEVNYIFCNDAYIHSINLEYLKHDTYTDIITFNNSEEEKSIESDVFISIERVKENSEKLSVPFEHELHRVMIHGVLHLCGFSDKTPTQKAEMRIKEDACLSLLTL